MSIVAAAFSPQLPSSPTETLTTPIKTEPNLWDSHQYGLLSPPFDSSAWPLNSPNSSSPSLPYSLSRSMNPINSSNPSDDNDLFTPRNLSQPKSNLTSPIHSAFLPSPSLSPTTYSNKPIVSSPSDFNRSSVSSDSSIPFVHAVAEVGYKFPLLQTSVPLPEEAATPRWEEGDTSIALRTPLGITKELSPHVPLSEKVKIEVAPNSPQIDHLAEYRLDRADGPCKPFISKLAHLLWTANIYEDVIKWDASGTCFLVAPSERFLTKVLPDIFAHSSFTAFTRQLKTYGFKHLSASQIESKFKYSCDTTTPIKDLSAWVHPLFTRATPGNLNRMLPKPSKARKAHQEEKMKAVHMMGRNF